MTRRELAKEQNRARIRAAASRIIREDGIEKLTMRRLADEADVSLRTPYNLFGSKTEVLIALIEEAGFDPRMSLTGSSDGLNTERLFTALGEIEQFFARDDNFYREVYGGIMSADNPDIRESSVRRLVATCGQLLEKAASAAELADGTDTKLLGRCLGINLLAVLGMWGAGLLSNSEVARQVRRTWAGVLLQHCSDVSRPALATIYAAASMENN